MERVGRRELLRALPAGASLLLAGCFGGGPTDPSPTSTGPSASADRSPTTSPVPASTATHTWYADGAPALALRETTFRERPASVLTARVVNEGSRTAVSPVLEATFTGPGGDLVQTNSDHVAYLRPGDTWLAYVPYTAGDGGAGTRSSEPPAIAEGTARVRMAHRPFRPDNEGLVVRDSGLAVGSSAARITAQIHNARPDAVGPAMVYGLFRRTDGAILASRHRGGVDLPAGETVSVDVGLTSAPVDRVAQLGDHTVLVVGDLAL